MNEWTTNTNKIMSEVFVWKLKSYLSNDLSIHLFIYQFVLMLMSNIRSSWNMDFVKMCKRRNFIERHSDVCNAIKAQYIVLFLVNFCDLTIVSVQFMESSPLKSTCIDELIVRFVCFLLPILFFAPKIIHVFSVIKTKSSAKQAETNELFAK